MSESYIKQYPCPSCGEEVDVDVGRNQHEVTCFECETVLSVEYDGDYDDYCKPVDLTKLIKKP